MGRSLLCKSGSTVAVESLPRQSLQISRLMVTTARVRVTFRSFGSLFWQRRTTARGIIFLEKSVSRGFEAGKIRTGFSTFFLTQTNVRRLPTPHRQNNPPTHKTKAPSAPNAEAPASTRSRALGIPLRGSPPAPHADAGIRIHGECHAAHAPTAKATEPRSSTAMGRSTAQGSQARERPTIVA